MVSRIEELDTAALVAETYYICIELQDNDELSSSICVASNTRVFVQQRRSTTIAFSDFMHEHFTWNTDPDCGLNFR
ncbi:hypothetical protein CC86DRAFT_259239, partial [Ophiobolus disseminans]